MKSHVMYLLVVGLMGWCSVAGALTMDFVTVGDVGNAADTRTFNGRAHGAVDYAYDIGKTEVTNAQYAEFLNAVAQSDPHALWVSNMGNSNAGFRGGITRSGSDGSYSYATITDRGNLPVLWANARMAMRFANWMNNGQTTDPASTESGAYDASTFNPYRAGDTSPPVINDARTHNSNAKYWLPTGDEWYKAAYYKGSGLTAGYWDYATQRGPISDDPNNEPNPGVGNYPNVVTYNPNYDGNDMTPVGTHTLTPGPYGTFDQNGNAWEMVEEWSASYPQTDRIALGGSYTDYGSGSLLWSSATWNEPGDDWNTVYSPLGFRLATVPEPATLMLLIAGLLGMAAKRKA